MSHLSYNQPNVIEITLSPSPSNGWSGQRILAFTDPRLPARGGYVYAMPSRNSSAAADGNWRVVYLRVKFEDWVEPENVYFEDLEAPGVYEVLVPTSLSDDEAASCAWGAFHSTIPLKELDGLQYQFWDGATLEELFPDPDLDIYEYAPLSQGFRLLRPSLDGMCGSQ